MLTLAQARLVAKATGRPPPSPLNVLDKALAKAGLSRSERRRLIAQAFGQSAVDPTNDERTVP